MPEGFEWDPEKAGENLRRHGISFEEAASVFDDMDCRTQPDVEHSTPGEERDRTIGQSKRRRTLVVIHTTRGDTIRIISARKATAYERDTYEEDW